MSNNSKAKYWTAVLYPENMVENWKVIIGDLLELPFAYCIHNADLTSDDEEDRKDHVHLIIVFNNTTTYKNAFRVFQRLGEFSLSACQSVINIRYMYEYLIHNTETCKKQNKHQYDPSERILGNNFDIGSYEQVSLAEKKEMRRELSSLILNDFYTNYSVFYKDLIKNFTPDYEDIVCSNSGHFERLCKGNYLLLNSNLKK